MRIGYARVSTSDQSINLQIDALSRFGCAEIFADEGLSGSLRERPGLGQTLARLRPGDDLVIWKLDRLGRSLTDLIDVVSRLEQRGVGLISVSEAIQTGSPGGVLVFHIMAALAEFERALISERTKAGMMSARARGRHVGRPSKLDEKQIAFAARQVHGGRATIGRTAARLGVSRATIYRALKKIPASSGRCEEQVAGSIGRG